RWISRDPIGEAGGWNLYGLVGNDGERGWDILGLQVDMAAFTPHPVPGATRGERHAPGKVLDPNDPSLTPEQKKAIEEGQSNLPRTQKDNGERCGRICRNRDGSLMSTNNEFTYY